MNKIPKINGKTCKSIIIAANRGIPKDSIKIKQPHWIANKIKNLMHQRRQFKFNLKRYNKIH